MTDPDDIRKDQAAHGRREVDRATFHSPEIVLTCPSLRVLSDSQLCRCDVALTAINACK